MTRAGRWQALCVRTFSFTLVLGGVFFLAAPVTAEERHFGFASPEFSYTEEIGVAAIEVTLSTEAANEVSVEVVVEAGTATADVDFELVSGRVVFAPGETSKIFEVPIIDDNVIEAHETVILTLTKPNGAGLTNEKEAILIIQNADGFPGPGSSVFLPPVRANESDGEAIIRIFLTRDNDIPVTIRGTTVDHLAIAGEDYVHIQEEHTFDPGVGVRATYFRIPLIDDSIWEPREFVGLKVEWVDNSGDEPVYHEFLRSYGADIRSDDPPPEPMVFSVGIHDGNLLNGTTNVVFLDHGIAEFDQDLPDIVGIGDEVRTGDGKVYLFRRESARRFQVRGPTGNIPDLFINNGPLSIHRTFASLNEAIATAGNSSYFGTTDLTAVDRRLEFACYGDGVDHQPVVIDGWTTSIEHRIRIFTPTTLDEVGVSQRHQGVWTASAYTLDLLIPGTCISLDIANVDIEGLQLRSSGPGANGGVVVTGGGEYQSYVDIEDCIIRLNESGHNSMYQIGIAGKTGINVDLNLANNLIYEIGSGTSPNEIGIFSQANTFIHAFNNTVIGGAFGFLTKAAKNISNLQASNNLVVGQTNASFNGTVATHPFYPSFTNLSDDETALGAYPIHNATVVFADSYHLDCSDETTNEACSAGYDVGSDYWIPFVDDIDGERRPRAVSGDPQPDETPWDIGADEVVYPKAIISSPDSDSTYWAGSTITLLGNESSTPKGYETWFAALIDDGSDPMEIAYLAEGLTGEFVASMIDPSYRIRLIVSLPGAIDDISRRGQTLPCVGNTECDAVDVILVGEPPVGPLELTAIPLSTTVVKLTWIDIVTKTTPYLIFRGTEAGNLFQIASVDSDQTIHYDTTVSPGETYYYQITNDRSTSPEVRVTLPSEDNTYLSLLPSVTTEWPEGFLDYHDSKATVTLSLSPEDPGWDPTGCTVRIFVDEQTTDKDPKPGALIVRPDVTALPANRYETEPSYGRDNVDFVVRAAAPDQLVVFSDPEDVEFTIANLGWGQHSFRIVVTDPQEISRERAFLWQVVPPSGYFGGPHFVGAGKDTATRRPVLFGYGPPSRSSADGLDADERYYAQIRFGYNALSPCYNEQEDYYVYTDENGYWEFEPPADLPLITYADGSEGIGGCLMHWTGTSDGSPVITGREFPMSDGGLWNIKQTVLGEPNTGSTHEKYESISLSYERVGGNPPPVLDSTMLPASIVAASLDPITTQRIRFGITDANQNLDAKSITVSNQTLGDGPSDVWMSQNQTGSSGYNTFGFWEADVNLGVGENSLLFEATDLNGAVLSEIFVINRVVPQVVARIASPGPSAWKSYALIHLDGTTSEGPPDMESRWVFFLTHGMVALPGLEASSLEADVEIPPIYRGLTARLVVATAGHMPGEFDLYNPAGPTCTLENSAGQCDSVQIQLNNSCCISSGCYGDGVIFELDIGEPDNNENLPYNEPVTLEAEASGIADATFAYRWSIAPFDNQDDRTLLTPQGADSTGLSEFHATFVLDPVEAELGLGTYVIFVEAGFVDTLNPGPCTGSVIEENVVITFAHEFSAVSPGQVFEGEAIRVYSTTALPGSDIEVHIDSDLDYVADYILNGTQTANHYVEVTLPTGMAKQYYGVAIAAPGGIGRGLYRQAFEVVAQHVVPSKITDPSCTGGQDFAAAIVPGQIVDSDWCKAGDGDGYYFNAVSGSSFNFRLERRNNTLPDFLPATPNPELFVVDPDGFVDTVHGYANDISYDNLDAAIIGFVAPKTGRYIIYCRSVTGSGDYTLTTERVSTPPASGFSVVPAGSRAVNLIEDPVDGMPPALLEAQIFDIRGLPAGGAKLDWSLIDGTITGETVYTSTGTGYTNAEFLIESSGFAVLQPGFEFPAAKSTNVINDPEIPVQGASLGYLLADSNGAITRISLPRPSEIKRFLKTTQTTLELARPENDRAHKLLDTCTTDYSHITAVNSPCAPGYDLIEVNLTLKDQSAVPVENPLTGLQVTEQINLLVELVGTCSDGSLTSEEPLPGARILLKVADLEPRFTRGIVEAGQACPVATLTNLVGGAPFVFEVGERAIYEGMDDTDQPEYSAIEAITMSTKIHVKNTAGWEIVSGSETHLIAPEAEEPGSINWIGYTEGEIFTMPAGFLTEYNDGTDSRLKVEGPTFYLLDDFGNVVPSWGADNLQTDEWLINASSDIHVNASDPGLIPWAGLVFDPSIDPIFFTLRQFCSIPYPSGTVPSVDTYNDETDWQICSSRETGADICSTVTLNNASEYNWITIQWPFLNDWTNGALVHDRIVYHSDYTEGRQWGNPASWRTYAGEPWAFKPKGDLFLLRLDPAWTGDLDLESAFGNTHNIHINNVPVKVWLSGPNHSPHLIDYRRENPEDPYVAHKATDVTFCTGEFTVNSNLALRMVGTCDEIQEGELNVIASTCPYGDEGENDGTNWGTSFGILKAPQEPGWYTIVAETDDPDFTQYSQLSKRWNIHNRWTYSFLVEPKPKSKSSCDDCNECVDGTIGLADGNLHSEESDPIPGLPKPFTERVYNSLNTVDENIEDIGNLGKVLPGSSAFFGFGWESAFDSNLDWRVWYRGTGSEPIGAGGGLSGSEHRACYITTETGKVYGFVAEKLGDFHQLLPAGEPPSTFTAVEGIYTLSIDGDPYDRVYSDEGSWMLVSLIERATGRTYTLNRDENNVPVSITDSSIDGAEIASFTVVDGRITQIDTLEGGSITYEYGGDQTLDTITVDCEVVRRYSYTWDRLSKIEDGDGQVIEEYQYSGELSSGKLSASSSVTGVTWGVTPPPQGRLPLEDETVVQVEKADSGTTYYYMRWVADRYRPVEVLGDCDCSGNDRVYGYSSGGYLTIEQDAEGFVNKYTYTFDGRKETEERGMQRADCLPADYPDNPAMCKLSPDALLALEDSGLVQTGAYSYREYAYDDENWPNKPTSICSPSVLNPSGQSCTYMSYDPVSGAWTSRMVSGWTGPSASEAVEKFETTNRSFYDGTTAAVFDPEGSFDPLWFGMPQPEGLLMAVDGPREDVLDQMQYVYYPFNPSVPTYAQGRPAAIQDALGHISRFEDYDKWGNAKKVTNASGVVTIRTYGNTGRLETSTLKGINGCDTIADPLCTDDLTTTNVYYQGNGKLESTESPGGMVTQLTYDSYGRVETSNRGPELTTLRERMQYEYDPMTHQRIRESRRLYDGGIWVEESQANSIYDTSGRLQTQSLPESATDPSPSENHYTYNASGSVATFQDANHMEPNVEYFYDAAGRLERVEQLLDPAAPSGGQHAITYYGYDSRGNLISVTDANGNVTTYIIDDFGRTTSIHSPVTGTTTMTYNEAGALKTRTDSRGVTMTNTYDEAGHLTTTVYDGSGMTAEQLDYEYDELGRRTLGRSTDVEQSFTHDRRGLVLSQTTNISGFFYETTYTYDEDGALAAIKYPSGRMVEYQRDFAGRPSVITTTPSGGGAQTVLGSAEYKPYGPPAQLVFGELAGLVTEDLEYDWQYRRRHQNIAGLGPVQFEDLGYDYDPAGNLTGLTDAIGSRGATYGYDDLGRLTNATYADASRTYTYDAIGNITKLEVPTDPNGTGSVEYAYELNSGKNTPILSSITAYDANPALLWQHSLTTDNAGNIETDSASTYQYDIRNHLETRQANGATIDNDFNADGRLTTTTRGATTTNIILDQSGRRLAKLENGTWRDYIYSGNRLIAFADQGAPGNNLVFSDHIGMPLMTADHNGNKVWASRTEPYGQLRGTINNMHFDPELRYPGQWQDEVDLEASCVGDVCTFPGPLAQNFTLFENGYRWYLPGLGRYTQSDPVGENSTGGLANALRVAGRISAGYLVEQSLFSYADNSPIGKSDPWGLYTIAPSCKCGVFDLQKIRAAVRLTRLMAKKGCIARQDISKCLLERNDLHFECGTEYCKRQATSYGHTNIGGSTVRLCGLGFDEEARWGRGEEPWASRPVFANKVAKTVFHEMTHTCGTTDRPDGEAEGITGQAFNRFWSGKCGN